jgi:hypothetical protein
VVASPYSGAAVRAGHFTRHRPSVAGVNSDHTSPDPEPDPFNPQPDVPSGQAGTVFTQANRAANPSGIPNLAQVPVTHWYAGQASVPSGETYPRAQLAMQERMLVDHADTNYVPDGVRLYQHVTEGQENEFQVGRPPLMAGASIPDGPLAGLGNGRNAYDQTNAPNEVYGSGGESNVGRYRLGVKTNVRGLYDNPIGKFGQDATIHAYTGLTPQFPTDKPQMTLTAPYTPNSTGTTHWAPAPAYQTPSLFTIPSETAITDFGTADATGSEFTDRDGGFF